jgi:group I intron endonuclease
MACIYVIRNVVNGKRYIGSAVNFKNRKAVHMSHLKDNKHHSLYLQRAWNRYGPDAFIFEVVEDAICRTELLGRETYWIEVFHPAYNVNKIVFRNDSEIARRKNGPMPEEQRRNISLAKKGRSNGTKGRKFTQEHKEKIAKAQKGSKRPWSDTSSVRRWHASLSEKERLAFYARRAASLRQTLQNKRAMTALNN